MDDREIKHMGRKMDLWVRDWRPTLKVLRVSAVSYTYCDLMERREDGEKKAGKNAVFNFVLTMF